MIRVSGRRGKNEMKEVPGIGKSEYGEGVGGGAWRERKLGEKMIS